LSNRLLDKDGEMVLSVSATTRTRRPGEAHGKDYFFVSEDEFTRMRDEGEFLEWANVFGHYYGTPRNLVEQTLSQGKDVLFDIDWQGAQQLAQVSGEDVVKVFILPPSREELERRLRKRAQDPEEIVQKRMAKADAEMSHWAEYDYVIVNYEIDESEDLLRAILFGERLKRRRQIGLAEIVKEMMGEE
ncbi:MAG: guanylate kinase, partial [Marinicaulis sp.]|nr:guanylate kinase [Marinicaulis sp.]